MLKRIFSFFRSKTNLSSIEIYGERKNKIFERINDLLGSYPKEEKYFLKAFTHRSFLDKNKEINKSNERLEFFGDAILGKIVAEYLFIKHPTKEEGYLTKVRSHIVNKHSLEKIGFNLKLHDLIFVNESYVAKEKKKLSNIIADCLEALIAAIYLDMGEEVAKRFIIEHIIEPQVESGVIYSDKNYKGQLLEYSHANKMNQPQYKVINQSGPQHDKIYTVEVSVGENIKGIGKGPNKKIAEQNAAKVALSSVSR